MCFAMQSLYLTYCLYLLGMAINKPLGYNVYIPWEVPDYHNSPAPHPECRCSNYKPYCIRFHHMTKEFVRSNWSAFLHIANQPMFLLGSWRCFWRGETNELRVSPVFGIQPYIRGGFRWCLDAGRKLYAPLVMIGGPVGFDFESKGCADHYHQVIRTIHCLSREIQCCWNMWLLHPKNKNCI